MNPAQFRAWLTRHDACQPALDWLGDRDAATAWAECPRYDWLLWWAGEAGVVVPCALFTDAAWSASVAAWDGSDAANAALANLVRRHVPMPSMVTLPCGPDAGLAILHLEGQIVAETRKSIRKQLRRVLATNGGNPFHPFLLGGPTSDAPGEAGGA